MSVSCLTFRWWLPQHTLILDTLNNTLAHMCSSTEHPSVMMGANWVEHKTAGRVQRASAMLFQVAQDWKKTIHADV
jgi:hypothetical protein